MQDSDGETARLATLLRSYAARCRSDSEAAHETVSASVRRLNGFQNQAVAGSGHRLLVDEPAAIGGRGEAADPAELLLAAVGASLSVTFTAHAALRGVPIDNLSVDLEGAMDARSFFEPGGTLPAGLLTAEIRVRVQTAAPDELVRRLMEDVTRASPVLNALNIEPSVTLSIESPR